MQTLGSEPVSNLVKKISVCLLFYRVVHIYNSNRGSVKHGVVNLTQMAVL